MKRIHWMGWMTRSRRTLLPFLDCRGPISMPKRHFCTYCISYYICTVFAYAEVRYHCIISPKSLSSPTQSSFIRVGSDAEESPLKKAKGNGIELNARGIPARKRKKNSLIYGADDLVSIFIIILIFLTNSWLNPTLSSTVEVFLSRWASP